MLTVGQTMVKGKIQLGRRRSEFMAHAGGRLDCIRRELRFAWEGLSMNIVGFRWWLRTILIWRGYAR